MAEIVWIRFRGVSRSASDDDQGRRAIDQHEERGPGWSTRSRRRSHRHPDAQAGDHQHEDGPDQISSMATILPTAREGQIVAFRGVAIGMGRRRAGSVRRRARNSATNRS